MLQSEGFPIYTIDELKEVAQECFYDEDLPVICRHTSFILAHMVEVKRYVIDLNISKADEELRK